MGKGWYFCLWQRKADVGHPKSCRAKANLGSFVHIKSSELLVAQPQCIWDVWWPHVPWRVHLWSHSPCVLIITSLGRVKGFVACRSCLASPFCQEVAPRPLQISKERKARGFFCKWSWKAHGSFHKQASLPSKQDPQTSTSGLGGNGGWRLVVKDGEAAKRWDPGIFSWKPVWCQGSLHQQPKEGA